MLQRLIGYALCRCRSLSVRCANFGAICADTCGHERERVRYVLGVDLLGTGVVLNAPVSMSVRISFQGFPHDWDSVYSYDHSIMF